MEASVEHFEYSVLDCSLYSVYIYVVCQEGQKKSSLLCLSPD